MPIRLDFDGKIKTGIVTVINESPDKLQVQMKASEWTQNSEGKDLYRESSDIIFFPKIIILNGKEERVIRVGTKIPPGAQEKAYRLYIEETPSRSAKESGVALNIAIRFGLPVFLHPREPTAAGVIDGLHVSAGKLFIPLVNTGNVHFRINTTEIRGRDPEGKEIFSQDLSGWYLLSGASRTHIVDIPQGVCRKLAYIDAVMISDKLTVRANTKVTGNKCGL